MRPTRSRLSKPSRPEAWPYRPFVLFAKLRNQYAGTDTGRRRKGVARMPGLPQPLYQMKADFFKTLGHPVRIRVLELLSQREHAVSEMLAEIGIEAANLSQQLSILRRAGLVTARREGLSVTYELTTPEVAQLLATARAILTGVVAGQAEALERPA